MGEVKNTGICEQTCIYMYINVLKLRLAHDAKGKKTLWFRACGVSSWP